MSEQDVRSVFPEQDRAEFNAFFPSPYSLGQFVSSTTGAQPVTYPAPTVGRRRKILVVATEERYMRMANGKKFSTGNHPVETLLPMYHIDAAGFEMDVATVAGYSAKFEMWAMPPQDALVQQTFTKYQPKFEQPLKLDEVVAGLGEDSPYAGVFLPGGHGAMLGLPESKALGQLLAWTMDTRRVLAVICHGPAALLAARTLEDRQAFLFSGYNICAFPDELDRQTPTIGYIPGPMPWYIGEKLKPLGVNIINQDITGRCHQDRNVFTGDSPLASDALGHMVAKALLSGMGQGV